MSDEQKGQTHFVLTLRVLLTPVDDCHLPDPQPMTDEQVERIKWQVEKALKEFRMGQPGYSWDSLTLRITNRDCS